MKNNITAIKIFGAMLVALGIQSCGTHDDKGRLKLENLTSTSGSIHFTPMMRSDSASVAAFKPDTLLYNGKPYTGAIGQYNQHQQLTAEGFAKNGLMDSSWKFYYTTGVVQMEGTYKNGWDIGLWRTYYTKDKPKIAKFYDDNGYMLMRIEYFDNGHVKNYQNVKSPLFDDKERHISMDQHGGIISIYVEDSVLMLKQGEKTEKIGRNVFMGK
jgi:hypothetical protein